MPITETSLDAARTQDAFTPATRGEALRRLHAFLPEAGKRYAARRNFDFGPGRHDAVSLLSPYVRHRLVSEEELVEAALASHGPAAAEKFVQEVFWRSYWKGWLELRPQVWARYRHSLSAALEGLEASPELAGRYRDALGGGTGIGCFDHWAKELVDTGYLHNHARMWFASIWIFTLKLPWELGADFFLRHLLDGDPASNTLSWRWVAGLQTKGKTYLAREDNIAKFTDGRFPSTPGLAKEAPELEEPDIPEPRALPGPETVDPKKATAVLLTEDDLTPDALLPAVEQPCGLFALKATAHRSPLSVSERVHAFTDAALQDAAQRLEPSMGLCQLESEPESLAQAIVRSGAKQVVTAYIPTGPTADALADLTQRLAANGIAIRQVRRAWDSQCWPYATHGFFRFKKRIPEFIEALV